MAPQAFELRIPDTAIADLKSRLSLTRFPDAAPGEPWAYGSSVDYVRDLVSYWKDVFDWRTQEAALNVFPQFKLALHDIDLHYLHVPGVGPNPYPLLLLHGWPGSVFEFLDIIPRLTDPARFGGDPNDAFTVIARRCPDMDFPLSLIRKVRPSGHRGLRARSDDQDSRISEIRCTRWRLGCWRCLAHWAKISGVRLRDPP